MKPFKEVAKKWHKSKAYRDAYHALEPEYALARAMIEARIKSKLSQNPSVQTLLNFAKATGTRLFIQFVDA